MPDIQALWRPAAFSAVGAGFLDDETLYDGVHLRWSFDHRFGLPFVRGNTARGHFRVMFRSGYPGTINDLDLRTNGYNQAFPVRNSQTYYPDAGMLHYGNVISFWKQSPAAYMTLLARCEIGLQSLRGAFHELDRQQRDFVRYAEEVLDRLRPEIRPQSITQAHSEACAVDLYYPPFSGGATGGQPDIRMHLMGLNRFGQTVASDWVGRYANGVQKQTARLRAPGIAAVRMEAAPGKPYTSPSEVYWVLCEEYCQAYIWSDDVTDFRFNGDPNYHTPEVAEQEHYRPFKTDIDIGSAADAIANFFVGTGEVQGILDREPVAAMASFKVNHLEEGGQGGNTALNLPVLSSLLVASLDPVAARILGLYGFFDYDKPEALQGHDVKVEAALPFFEAGNLFALDDALVTLGAAHGVYQQHYFCDPGQPTPGVLYGARFCGLVLAPHLMQQEQPAPPDAALTVTVNDVPAQDDPAQMDLLVDSRLILALPGGETPPHLGPAAYLVERRLSGQEYSNAAADDEGKPDPLADFGLLPPVFMARRGEEPGEPPLSLRDSFRIPAQRSDAVEYRLQAFDLFGRPSPAVEDLKQLIELPCHAPGEPSNLACHIVSDGDLLFLETTFSIPPVTKPLEAIRQQLEITLHALPDEPEEPAPPETTTWPGIQMGRLLRIGFGANAELDLSSLASACLQLQWNGQTLSRLPYAEAGCAEQFPPVAPVIEPIDLPALPYATTGYRSYRLRIAVGQADAMAPDAYRWCIRLRIQGRNPETSATLYSAEPCAAADWLIPPPPPAVVQPETAAIPVSSYPDTLGNSYYMLDLSVFGLAEGSLANIYQARLDRITETPETLVAGNCLLDRAAFLQAARANKQPFELLTAEPVTYRSADRFYSVAAPGDLRHYYVLAVTGTTPYLQERKWSDAAFVLFTTPEPAALPALHIARVEPFTIAGQPRVRLEYTIPAAGWDGTTYPPKVQIMRRDLSINSASAYVGEATAETGDADPTRLLFRFVDTAVRDWHRYEYTATLLVCPDGGDSYLRSTAVVRCQALTPWGGIATPWSQSDSLRVDSTVYGYRIATTFDAGEFDLVLSQILPHGGIRRIHGSVREGVVHGLGNLDHELTVIRVGLRNRYQLTIQDTSNESDAYTLRLSYGPEANWTKSNFERMLKLNG